MNILSVVAYPKSRENALMPNVLQDGWGSFGGCYILIL